MSTVRATSIGANVMVHILNLAIVPEIVEVRNVPCGLDMQGPSTNAADDAGRKPSPAERSAIPGTFAGVVIGCLLCFGVWG